MCIVSLTQNFDHPARRMACSRRAVERREVRVGVPHQKFKATNELWLDCNCGGGMLGVVVGEVVMTVGVIEVRACVGP